MRASLAWALVLAGGLIVAAQVSSPGLRIYLIDVEGGGATLFVAPSGASVLIDTGNPGAAAGRDAERIAAAAEDAGVRRLDHHITTHWHGDHYGAMAEVIGKLPVAHFIDHGPTVEKSQSAIEFLADRYPKLRANAKHTVVKPGDTIPVAGLEWRIVTSGGKVMKTPLSGAGSPNPHCATFTPQAPDAGENAQSVGSHITFGKFRVVHLGDLTWNTEFDLMCPNNPLGTADLFVVSHHGQPISNAEVLVHALRPRVAIMNNGTRKGGQPAAMKVLHSAPGLEDLWQLHFSLLSGQEYTVPGMFIANLVDEQAAAMPIEALPPPSGPGAPPPPRHDGPAHWIKVVAQADGTFTVANARNGFSKAYAADPRR